MYIYIYLYILMYFYIFIYIRCKSPVHLQLEHLSLTLTSCDSPMILSVQWSAAAPCGRGASWHRENRRRSPGLRDLLQRRREVGRKGRLILAFKIKASDYYSSSHPQHQPEILVAQRDGRLSAAAGVRRGVGALQGRVQKRRRADPGARGPPQRARGPPRRRRSLRVRGDEETATRRDGVSSARRLAVTLDVHQDDEYVVYGADQVKLRYAVRFSVKGDRLTDFRPAAHASEEAPPPSDRGERRSRGSWNTCCTNSRRE